MIRSSMASATVASPIHSCQCSMGSWLVMIVAFLPARSAGQEHGATGHAVCLEQLVDGQKANYSGSARMSAPARRANALQRPVKAANGGPYGRKIAGKALLVSLCGFLTVDSRCGEGCADFP